MLNKEIISSAVPSLHLNDPVSQALDLMADFHVTHLPVVAGEKLAGLVSEEDLLNIEDDSTLLSELQPGFSAIVAHAEAYFLKPTGSLARFLRCGTVVCFALGCVCLLALPLVPYALCTNARVCSATVSRSLSSVIMW